MLVQDLPKICAMLIAMPVLCFFLLWSALCRATGRGFIGSALVAVTLMGVFASVTLEALSLGRMIVPGAVDFLWCAACLGAGVFCFQAHHANAKVPGLRERLKGWMGAQTRERDDERGVDWRGGDRMALMMAGVGCAFLLVVLVVAVVSPPNAWDGLTYHLPRVMHWMQNGTLEHYPSHILRQLWMNPFAEEAVLHTYMLSGSDRFANCVQWAGYLFGALGAVRGAQLMGAGSRGQMFAWVFALSVPIVALQASGPQTDVVVGAWLIIAGVFTLELIKRDGKAGWLGMMCDAALVGAALGLACLTKGTAYLFGLGIAVALGCWVLRRTAKEQENSRAVESRAGERFKKRLAGAVVIVVVFAVLNGPFVARNVGLFGKPFGPGVGDQRNDRISILVMFSNMLRTAALQLAPPDEGGTITLGRAVIGVHEALGLDVNDPGTSFEGRKFQLYPMRFHEDTAPNPAHVLLGGACVLLVVTVKARRANRALFWWVVGTAAGVAVFFLLIRWQPWSSRLLAPVFLLLAPVVGVVLEWTRLVAQTGFSETPEGRVSHWRVSAAGSLGALLIGVCALSGIVAVTLSETRPILRPEGTSVFKGSRMDHYIVRLPDRAAKIPEVMQATQGKEGLGTLGWISEEEDFEYLAWLALEVFGHKDARLEHVEVTNASKDAPAQNELKPGVMVLDVRRMAR